MLASARPSMVALDKPSIWRHRSTRLDNLHLQSYISHHDFQNDFPSTLSTTGSCATSCKIINEPRRPINRKAHGPAQTWTPFHPARSLVVCQALTIYLGAPQNTQYSHSIISSETKMWRFTSVRQHADRLKNHEGEEEEAYRAPQLSILLGDQPGWKNHSPPPSPGGGRVSAVS